MMLLGDVNTTATVSYTADGFSASLTSSTATGVTELQKITTATLQKNPLFSSTGTTVNVANITGGITVTATSTNATTAQNLINFAKREELMKKLRAAKINIQAVTTRTVSATDSGVQINLSSSNADVAQLIQLNELYKPAMPTGNNANGFGRRGPHGRGGEPTMMDGQSPNDSTTASAPVSN